MPSAVFISLVRTILSERKPVCDLLPVTIFAVLHSGVINTADGMHVKCYAFSARLPWGTESLVSETVALSLHAVSCIKLSCKIRWLRDDTPVALQKILAICSFMHLLTVPTLSQDRSKPCAMSMLNNTILSCSVMHHLPHVCK